MSSYLQPDVEADHLVQYTEIMLSIKGFSRNRILLMKKMICWSFFRRRWLQPFLEIPAMVANWIWSWWLVSGKSHTLYSIKNAGKKSVVCSTCLLYLIETWHMETISSCVWWKKKGLINFFWALRYSMLSKKAHVKKTFNDKQPVYK